MHDYARKRLFTLTIKEDSGPLTAAERHEYKALLSIWEADEERRADDAWRGQCWAHLAYDEEPTRSEAAW